MSQLDDGWKQDGGGPAFPVDVVVNDFKDNELRCVGLGRKDFGMSLLDYFASKAMEGDWAAQNEVTGEFANSTSDDFLLARAALYYRMGRAMLAARDAGKAVSP